MKNISYEQAMSLFHNNKATLLDVQTEEDYKMRHLSGSINIPVEDINSRAIRTILNKNSLIIVYCLKGIRSLAASDMLTRLGYSNVYNIIRWHRALIKTENI